MVGDNVIDKHCKALDQHLLWTPWCSLSFYKASVSELTFESMSRKAHQVHIALSELMTSIVMSSETIL